MQSIINYLKEPRLIFVGLLKKINFLFSDKLYLRIMFYLRMKEKLNLDSPQTFNEKLQWLKLYDRNPIYVNLVDKVKVKEYVENVLSSDVIIPTLGVWKSFEEIDFSKLPNQFVLKTNHSGGNTGVVICKNKASFDYVGAKKRLERSLKTNPYKTTKEWPYKNVIPCILAEKYIEDDRGILEDYKFWCFNGRVECVFICEGRNSNRSVFFNFYNREWKRLPFAQGGPTSDEIRPKPAKLDLMIRYAEQLAKDKRFVRVDFYYVDSRIYFGEITFFDSSGFGVFKPKGWDLEFGKLLNLKEQ
ncbi:ATP-grasp fold amidoligase family protein [Bacteroides sp.]|uniref:ATP-grasp fold amidoligase family protein n=1 Tax=Bacteroides sp. TaxID=29523 RepID=UPI002591133F|nr:ATP-grasp fold amidoligase family protein [Bacteroides sp.]